MKRDSVLGTFGVATALCTVCSVLVSMAAVGLRPRQAANKQLFQKKNILLSVGLIKDGERVASGRINELFADIETILIDLDTGRPTDAVDIETYDQKKAARDPQLSVKTEGLVGFQSREKYSRVYLLKDRDGKISKVVLPVYGKGLWSTLYGYLALEKDKNTIAGLTFYDHRETPGLGGEVDNPIWKAKWVGKKVSDGDDIVIEVVKGTVDSSADSATHQIDGLSGATITSRGVSNLVRYWMSERGFGKYLEQL